MKNTLLEETKDKISILIIDDEPSIGDALRIVLESNGYDVVLVAEGREGIEQAGNRRFGFGIVDLFLNDISGLEVIKQIHEQPSQIPTVLISAQGTPQVFAEAKKLGAIGCLSKPFLPADILPLISAALTQT